MPAIRNILGIAGVDPSEKHSTQITANCLHAVILLILYWLFLREYLISIHFVTVSTANDVGWGIWAFFVFETTLLTTLCKRHAYYFSTNWLNIVIIILSFPPIWEQHGNYAALLRILRVVVILYKALPLGKKTGHLLSTKSLSIILGIFILITIMAGVVIYYIDSGITSPWQGIWWAFQTITTVGYGDVIPQSVYGRLFAIVFMLFGVGLLATLSASFAYFLLKKRNQAITTSHETEILKQLRTLQTTVMELKKDINTPPNKN
ncbi:MAG: hypothetical protein COB66_09125 [Coxiella sp. (in: Bacteria)]|nr:MAG: hypothetical protein COB66_09125 [Coxiella sp. (in: g-proteobacteria)]